MTSLYTFTKNGPPGRCLQSSRAWRTHFVSLLTLRASQACAQDADQVILIDGTVKKQGTVRQVYESEEFQKVFGRFDLENYKPSRQAKEQKEKEMAMPKHNHGLWKEEE